MRVSQLRAFLTTVDSGSFTAAARRLGISQPSVSELVRSLEDECGLALFIRAGRSLVLTSAGAELLPWARRAVESVAGAEHLARSLNGLDAGVAAFGVLRNAQFYFLSSLAEEFHSARIRMSGFASSGRTRSASRRPFSGASSKPGWWSSPCPPTGSRCAPDNRVRGRLGQLRPYSDGAADDHRADSARSRHPL